MHVASLLIHSIRGRTRQAAKLPVTLDNIQVAAPCSMSWEKMNGDDRVRHCQECTLKVYNLSDMTRGEAERLIASREGRLCVRFYRRADGTILTRNCPRGLRRQIDRVTRFAGAALSAVMSLGGAFAQTTPPPAPPNESATQGQKPAQKKTQLVLTVVDPQGMVVANAKVQLEDKRGKSIAMGTTRADGSVLIPGLTQGSFLVTIIHGSFEPHRGTIEIKKEETLSLRITLNVRMDVVGILIAAPMRDTDDSQLKTTFSGDLLQQLPLR